MLRAAFLVSLIPLTPPGAEADDPAWNLVLRAHVDDHSAATDVWGYRAPDGTELAIYGHLDGTSFVDATDPGLPVEVLNLPGPVAGARDIKTYLHYAYVVLDITTGGGLQIVDLSDPFAPTLAATYTGGGFSNAHNLWIDADAGVAYACGAGPASGMHVLSLADPVAPVELDYFDAFGIHDLWVGNGVALCASWSTGALGEGGTLGGTAALAARSQAGIPAQRWRTSSRRSCVKGLLTKSSIPASKQAVRSSTRTFAVMATIGVRRSPVPVNRRAAAPDLRSSP